MSNDMNRLISRLMMGKPDIDKDTLRRLVPQTRTLTDQQLSGKLHYLKGKAPRQAVKIPRRG